MQPLRHHECARAQAWVSLRLDGELSEFEGALLDAHLAGCAACSAGAVALAETTGRLRGASLELPARRVRIARHPRRPLVAIRTASALAVVLAIALVPAFETWSREGSPPPPPPPVPAGGFGSFGNGDLRKLREIRRNELLLDGLGPHVLRPNLT